VDAPAEAEQRKPMEIVLLFEESLPGVPLPETVWDNIVGPFQSKEESEQIGYTQHRGYGTAPIAPPGVAIGMYHVSSQIVIPLGRIVAETFCRQLGLSLSSPTVYCAVPDKGIALRTDQRLLRVKIDKASVWEKPLNHLNLSLSGQCSLYDAQQRLVRQYSFEKQTLKNSISVGGMTAKVFIKNMMAISNRFARDVARDAITQIQVEQ
jgi:hypothetical protein